jgi:hypothetical protein
VGAAALGSRDVIAVAGLISPLAEGKCARLARPLTSPSPPPPHLNGVVATDDLVYQGGLTGNMAHPASPTGASTQRSPSRRTQVKRASPAPREAVRVIPTGITQGGRDAVRSSSSD